MRGDDVLVDRRHPQGPRAHLGRDRAHRRRQLDPPVVVDRQRERHPVVRSRQRLGLVEHAGAGAAGNRCVAPSDPADPHAARVQLVTPGEQHPLGVGEQGARPRPADRPSAASGTTSTVSQRNPIAERALDDVDERRLPRRQPHRRRRSRRGPGPGAGRRRSAGSPAQPNPRFDSAPPLRSRPMRAAPDAWTAVVNPAAGRGRGDAGLPHLVDTLARAASTSRSRCRPTPTISCASRATRCRRGRGVVACGGDGTVCALAGVAADERRRARHRAGGLGQRLRPSARDPSRRPRRRHRRAAHRPRRHRRPRTGAHRRRRDDVVHHRRQHRVRRRGQRVGEPDHVGERDPALRDGHAAHLGHVLAAHDSASPSTTRPSTPRRGWSRSATPAPTRAG